MKTRLISLMVVLSLVTLVSPLATAAPAPLDRGSADPGIPVITANPQVLQRTWDHVTTFTLTNGLPGHKGYFAVEEMTVQCWVNNHRDIKDLNQIIVTVDNSARVSLSDCFSWNSGDSPVTFFDLTLGRKLPTSMILRVYDHPPVPPPPPSAEPAIVQVTSDYPFGGHYLQGVSAPNTIRASVDFKGQFGYVKFILNGEEHRVDHSSGGVFSYTLDLGRDLRLGPNSLRTIAYNTTGQASQPDDHMFLGLPSMKWLNGVRILSPFVLEGRGVDLAYVARAEFPLDGFQFQAPGFITPDQNNQTELGLRVKGSITVPVICQPGHPIVLEGKVSDALRHRLYILNLQGNLSANGRIVQQFVDCSVFDPQLEGHVAASAAMSADAGGSVFSIVKDLMGTFWGLVASLIVPGSIGVSGNLNTNLGANVKAEVTPPYFQANAGLDGQLGLQGAARIFYGLAWSHEFEAYFGGAGSVVYASPGYIGNFNDLYFKTAYGHNMHIILSDTWGAHRFYDKTFTVQCDYPLVGDQSCVGRSQSGLPGGWTPHGAAADYSPLVQMADSLQPLARSAAEAMVGTPVTSTLATDVYTATRVSLAVNPANGQALLLWTHDDLDKPLGSSHEIYYSRWTGSQWQPAAPLTENLLLDEAPQVAWTGEGQAVAVWHQLTAAQPITGPLPGAAAQIELLTAVYNPQTNRWSTPQPLTANERFEAAGRLARNHAGQLMLPWVESNASGGPETLSAQAGDVRVAFYDHGWSAPQVVAADVTGLAEIAAAYGEGEAAVAFTRLITPTGETEPQRALYVSTWDGGDWSEPQAEGSQGQDHGSPNVWFSAAGNPVIGWVTGGVFHTHDLVSDARAQIVLAETAGVDRVRALPQANGGLALLSRQLSDDQTLQVVYFDPATNLAGAARELTAAQGLTGPYDAALGPDGRVVMAYAATELVQQPASAVLSTGQVVTFTVPTPGRTDLVALGYRFDRNLTVNSESLQLSSAGAQPGSPARLAATVMNTGDLPISGIMVRFYDGDPQTTGVVFDEVTIQQPLASGASAVFQTDYMVPTEGGIRDLFIVVDPNNAINESTKADNTAHRQAFGPDLAITAAQALTTQGSQALLQAQVRNVGASSTATTTLSYSWPDAPDTALVTATIPALSIGQAITLTAPWQFEHETEGGYPLVASANQGDFPELDVTNNVYSLTLSVRPDLVISPYTLDIGDLSSAQTPITLTVRNLGVITATDVLVGFYDYGQMNVHSQVFTRTIPLLGPGAEAVLTGILPQPAVCGVFAWVDPENRIEENKENNMASRLGPLGHCASRLYLPLIRR